MGGITERVVEEIKARIDLADLISSYGIQVRHAGASLKACCPFHHEKTPSFNINQTKGFYHCFGCGESGDAIKFVMKQEGLTFVEAVKKLAQQCGVTIEEKEDPEAGLRKRLYALMAELAQFYHRCLLKTKEAEPAREYLKSRDLDGPVQDDFLIGYAPNGIATILKWAKKYGFTADELEKAGVIKAPNRPGDQGYHRFGGRLMFSIRDKQGRVVAFSGRQLVASKNSGKYVNSPETVIFKKSNVLFGFDRAAGNIVKAPHREAIVCEGQIDTIRLHISGFPVAVASQGTAFTEEHVKMLKKAADQAVLVFDDDGAGHKATIRTAGLMLAAEMPVRIVSLPGGDDPDSFLRTKGAEAFQALLDKGESIISFQVRVEKQKEEKPDSLDAVARVSKAVLGTIAACPSAILRSAMLDEAARLMHLPVLALGEELEKRMKDPRPAAPAPEPEPEPDEERDLAEDYEAAAAGPTSEEIAAAEFAVPPPEKELALCEFLLAHCGEKPLDGMVGEFLPRKLFAHDFTRAFIDAWLLDAGGDANAMAAFGEKLSPAELGWLDKLMLGAAKTGASSFKPTEILQDFIRALWSDYLKRLRGDLPATGESDARRMELSMALKRLARVRWAEVKDFIRGFSDQVEPE